MLSGVTAPRYFPRTPQELAFDRRGAAVRAALGELSEQVAKLEREQQVQLQRIAQLQAEVDSLKAKLRPGPKRRAR